MENSIDFKGLWKGQTTHAPDMKELVIKLKALKRKGVLKLIFTNIALAVTSVLILLIWYYYQPGLLSSKVGIVLVLAAMFIFLMAYNRLLPLFQKIQPDKSNADFLEHLIAIRSSQRFLQSTMLNLYFVLLSGGVFLYMYEPCLQMTKSMAITAYALTSMWIGFNWFYIRPRSVKKQESVINSLIDQFKAYNDQLNDPVA